MELQTQMIGMTLIAAIADVGLRRVVAARRVFQRCRESEQPIESIGGEQLAAQRAGVVDLCDKIQRQLPLQAEKPGLRVGGAEVLFHCHAGLRVIGGNFRDSVAGGKGVLKLLQDRLVQ